MARCAWSECGGWRPDLLAGRGRTGVVLDGTWYCSQSCVEHAASRTLEAARQRTTPRGPVPIPPLKLGMLLVHQGVLTPMQLEAALAAQRAEGLRLGAYLRREGLVGRVPLLRALAAQSSAPYLPVFDVTAVRHVPSALSPNAVRALGLVPFDADTDRQRVKVACVAPVPRLALRALTQLTGWVGDPFIVDDEVMPALLQAYAAGPSGRPGEGRETATTTIPAAAAQIARTAARGRGARVRHAACDPFLWVRVEGDQGADDLIVDPAIVAKEQSCRAEHTSR